MREIIYDYFPFGKAASVFVDNLLIGNSIPLSRVYKLEENFDEINLYRNGIRFDDSLEDWKIKAGDKEVQILTDNNVISEEYSKKHGIRSFGGVVITNDMQNSINEALQTLNEAGQDIPDKIYLSELSDIPQIIDAAHFNPNSNKSIFLMCYLI